jgi:Ran GTPase-activating protein (RanGAP) involved in mRNA processing and transport
LNTYPYYEKLAFWRANLGDQGAVQLFNWIKPNPYLKVLELMDNRIGLKGCSAISRALEHNEALHTLILDYNDIGDEGATILSVGVSWNPTLALLSLKYCGIGEEGGVAIGSLILAKSPSLTELDLQGNPLGNRGISALGEGLKNSQKLTKLNISATSTGGIVDSGAIEKFCEGVTENKDTLTDINLHLNAISDVGAQKLLELVTAKPTITRLKLYEQVNKDFYKQICDVVAKNKVTAAKKKKPTSSKKGGKKSKK